MITIEQLIIWNSLWVYIWGICSLGVLILLFLSKGKNGIYRAMRWHIGMVTAFLFVTAITVMINVVTNPEGRYWLAISRAVVVPGGVATFFYLAYEIWKDKS
jgi:hypothetical protein